MADAKKSIKDKTVSGFAWRFAERCGAQGISFVVSIVLARLLDPSDYGVIALVTVFTTILQVFVDSGMGTALVQKKDADNIDFSSVFYFNVIWCTFLYLLLFFASPLIADFYNDSELVPVIRVLGITILISGVKNIQQSYVSKHMLFKRFFYATLGGTLGSAVVGIAMAYMGFGVWALVAQNLFNTTIDTVVLWFTVKWRPVRAFSIKRLKSLFNFGWKLLVSTLVHTIYRDIRQLVIGKMYTSSDLAYYNRGKQFPNLIVVNINSSIDSVLLPAMASEQDDNERVKNMTRRSIKTSSYIMWPLMIGLSVCAEPVIRLILTEKWLYALPYLRIFCISYAFEPIQTANLNAIKAVGRSGLLLKLEIIKKSIGLILLIIAMPYGVMSIGLSTVVYSIIASILNALPNKKMLKYSYFEQILDILPSAILSGVMGIIIYPICFLNIPDILVIIIQIIVGAAIYIIGSIICRFDSYQYVLETVKDILKKN